MGYSSSSSNDHTQAQPLRRKADVEALQQEILAVDALAMALCPKPALVSYRQRSFTQQRHGKKVTVLPLWRHYRKDAKRLLAAYRLAPWLMRFPVRIAQLAAEVLLNCPSD